MDDLVGSIEYLLSLKNFAGHGRGLRKVLRECLQELSERKSTRILVFKDGKHWIAQCLEVDVAAQADDIETLVERIEVALELEKPHDRIPKAPDEFFDRWKATSGERYAFMR